MCIFYPFSEAIIRLAFQSLQLVVTDFLPIIPCWCLQVLVDVAGKFGLQPNEINISLTAVGLLVRLKEMNLWKYFLFEGLGRK